MQKRISCPGKLNIIGKKLNVTNNGVHSVRVTQNAGNELPELKKLLDSIPEIRVPEIRVPEIRVPEIRVSEILVPEIRISGTRIETLCSEII